MLRWPSAVLAAALLAACAGDTGGQPPVDGGHDGDAPVVEWELVAEATIGPEGGSIDVPDDVQLLLPEGSLPAATSVRVWREVEPSALQGATVDGYYRIAHTRIRIEPVELTLGATATLSVWVDESDIPVRATADDVAIRRGEELLPVVVDAATSSLVIDFGAGHRSRRLRFSAFPDAFGTFELGIRDPYAEPPSLDAVRASIAHVYSTRDGVQQSVDKRLAWLELVGAGFGWDVDRVQVTVDGVEMELAGATNREVSFQLNLPDPLLADATFSVRVIVDGRTSNALPLRVAADKSCRVAVSSLAPKQAPPGMQVLIVGPFCGTLETRRVHIGGRTVAAEWNAEFRKMAFTVPDDLEVGWHEVSVSDGLGGSPGDSKPLYVLPDAPLVLGPGVDGAGLVLPTREELDWRDWWPLILDVANLEPDFDIDLPVPVKLEVRYRTPHGTFDWELVSGAGDVRPACEGLESGRCMLQLPRALLASIEEGDTIEVTLRVRRYVYPSPGTDDGLWYVRESAPLTVPVRSIALPGATRTIYLGYEISGTPPPFCAWESDSVVVAVGETVCLRVHVPECVVGGSCEDRPHLLHAPGLFTGTFAAAHLFTGGRDGPLREWCFLASSQTSYEVDNLTLGQTCRIDVERFAPSGPTYMSIPWDSERDTVVTAGGARLRIPAGALPPPAWDDEYQLTFTADRDPGESSLDPVRGVDQFVSIGFSPPVFVLHEPLDLTIPYEPNPVAPAELGLIDPDTSMVHLLDAAREVVDGLLEWEIPAGRWGTESQGTHLPLVMPVSMNDALRRVGVITRSTQPGMLFDSEGRVVVDYVPDATSPHHVPESVALEVLNAAVQGYEFLATDNGWRRPDYPVHILIRESVSWADFTGLADGATDSGFLGQPTVALRSTMAADKFRYTAIHEMGHVFQRQYTTNLVLHWLDEGVGEWVAWGVLGDDYPVLALTEDHCAVQLAAESFPSTWTMVLGPSCHYGSAPWLFWLDKNFGSATIRRIYELISDGWTGATNPRRVIEQAAGLSSIRDFLGPYADDFWVHAAPVVDRISLNAPMEAMGWAVNRELTQQHSLVVSLLARPPLSSVRYRVHVSSSALDDPLYGGNLVLRAQGLKALQGLRVLHEPTQRSEVHQPVEVAQLSDANPVVVLPRLEAGTYWIIDNNRSETFTATGHALHLERPRITGLSPSSAAAGQSVSVDGDHFRASPGTLRVGGQNVTPTSWGNGRVTFTMPSFPNTSSVGVVIHTHEQAQTNQVFLAVQGD